YGLVAHQVTTWKAMTIESRALVGAAASAANRERRHRPARERFDLTNARGVKGVGLRDDETAAVELRATARSHFKRQAKRRERARQTRARRVDGGSVLQGRPKVLEDVSEQRRLGGQEV